jgi:hypothetical protein
MPMDIRRYPRNWRKVSFTLRKAARWQCEWCGLPQGAPLPRSGYRCILTVAHLGAPYPDGRPGDKHDKHDLRRENLAVLCQRCHLNYDRRDHQAVQAFNRRQKRAQRLRRIGQLKLIEEGLT